MADDLVNTPGVVYDERRPTIQVDLQLLGKSMAVETRALEKEERAQRAAEWKKAHPKIDKVLTVIGWRKLDKHVLIPASDWWTDHEGLGVGLAAASSAASMGLLAGGAAR